MKRRASIPDTTQAAIAAFLDEYCTHPQTNDVGPLFGRLASLQDAPANGARVQRQWNAAVSIALTGGQPDHAR